MDIQTTPESVVTMIEQFRGVDDAHLGAYLALLGDEGWPRPLLAQLAQLEPTELSTLLKPRKALRDAKKELRELDVPEYEAPATPPTRSMKDPSPELIARVQKLYPLAKRSTSARPLDDPYRKASDELTELLFQAREDGVSPGKLAAAVGMRPGTIRARLARRGMIPAPPSVDVFIGAETREKEKCANGHPMSGDNLSIIHLANGKTRRGCKECRRENTARWRARRAENESSDAGS
ncbi:hypothetical protein GS504_01265 [Rhodococcus hoagii]|nr:hypothetical protein [Prescottella equi]NKS71697.1 hypothetical protein [Prescottella equi]